MEHTYEYILILFVSTISSVSCHHSECFVGLLVSGLTIVIMSVIIICLSIALYMIKNNKSIFQTSNAPTYLRQESGQGVTLCNVTSSININDQCRHDGSTLTVYSGIVEIGGPSEPETPTQKLEENKTIQFKKHKGRPLPPIMQKAQMDEIITGVLNRKQKSDSATFRELDALTKMKIKQINQKELPLKRNAENLDDTDGLASENDECLYENRQAISEMIAKCKPPVKNKLTKINQNLKQSKSYDNLQPRLPNEAKEDEHEVYDTLPSPKRCHSDPEDDSIIENIPVYDLPPQRARAKKQPRNVIVDQDNHYLVPISLTSDEECYINAKMHN